MMEIKKITIPESQAVKIHHPGPVPQKSPRHGSGTFATALGRGPWKDGDSANKYRWRQAFVEW